MIPELNKIISSAVLCKEEYVLDGQYIMWGIIEKDIAAIILESRRWAGKMYRRALEAEWQVNRLVEILDGES